MIRARSSIAGMLAAIALLAVGFAAFKVSSRLWAAAMFSFALFCLVAAVAATIHRRGATRAWSGGFALFGVTYLLAALGPPPLNAWKDWLITTPFLAVLEEQLRESPPTMPIPPAISGTRPTRIVPTTGRIASARPTGGSGELTPWGFWTTTDRSNPFGNDSFLRIGHSVCCLIVASLGGVFCLILHDTRP